MRTISGEIKNLRANQRSALDRLASKRLGSREVLEPEFAKRAAKLCSMLGVQLGVLAGRDGRIAHLVVGTKEKIYLPDLGRFRLDAARLRRLRLLVFVPEDQAKLCEFEKQTLVFGEGREEKRTSAAKRNVSPRSGGQELILAPEIANDLLTDLEKLRLDAVLVVASTADGSPDRVSMAYLKPGKTDQPVSVGGRRTVDFRGIAFYHAKDVYELDFDFELFVKDLESRFSASRGKGYDTSKDHAVLVGAYTGSLADARSSMDELDELTRTAEIQVLDSVIQRRRSLDPKTVIGKGKIEELVLHCLDLGADLLIFDRELTPGQLRSIGNLTELRVIDRSMLILDIFAQRAKSSEGRLQVELAQLKYSLPRLTEKDTGLSRLTGGIGGRGPGETKLEVSRRRARQRIAELEKRIEKLARQRGLRRERRQSRGVPVIAIVGYTNAGKSTLLNALTKGTVLVESKLFATLDPASRRMRFPNDKEVIFVDTVGFIRELPRELVTAFRATLEEVGEADFLIHVVDATNQEMKMQIEVVEKTLESLGFGDTPKVLVLNKIDLLSALEVRTLVNTLAGIPVSAVTRQGFPPLVESLQQQLAKSFEGQDPGRFIETSPW